MDPLRLFLLDQGIPVEYEWDKFNTPHTGATLFHPQKLAMLIAMSNSTPAPSNYFTSGQHFLKTFRFSTKQPETQTHGDSKVYFLQRQTWLSLHTVNIPPSHVQQHTLLSQLYLNSISSVYFFPFPRGLQHKRKLYIPCCH